MTSDVGKVHKNAVRPKKVGPHQRVARRRTQELTLQRRMARHNWALQTYLARFTCACLGVCCLTSLALFCLQGFHAWGFGLETGLMHWLGGATIGAIGAVASMVYRGTFLK
jgi:hypothetical protein